MWSTQANGFMTRLSRLKIMLTAKATRSTYEYPLVGDLGKIHYPGTNIVVTYD